MLSFPVSPGVGQQFQSWTWDGVKWTPTKTARCPKCGLLQLNGSTPSQSLIFIPFNGDEIKVNGLIYRIPAAGILATNGSLYINKVAGSTLTLSQLYFVYVFFDGTALRLNFSPTGHATSTTAGNVGTEIRQGDDSQTLVGVIMPGGASPVVFYDHPQYRYTRSWFNRPRTTLSVGGSITQTPAVQSWTGLTSCIWIGFSDDRYYAYGTAWGTSAASTNLYLGLQLNSALVGQPAAISTPHGGSAWESTKSVSANNSSEGNNGLVLVYSIDYADTVSINFLLTCFVAGTY
jgi:hypothetical protein